MQKILVFLIKLVKLRVNSQHRSFPFGHLKDSEELRQRGWKDSERTLSRMDENIHRDFCYEQFPTRNSCIRKYTTEKFMWIMVLQPRRMIRSVKAV